MTLRSLSLALLALPLAACFESIKLDEEETDTADVGETTGTSATDGTGGTDGTDGTDGTTDGADGGTDGTAGTDGSDGTTDGSDGTTDGADGTTDGSDGGTDGSDGSSSSDVVGSQNILIDTDTTACVETYDLTGTNTGWCPVCSYSFEADLIATASATCGFGNLTQSLGFLVGYGSYPDSLVYLGSTYIYLMADLTSIGGGSAAWLGEFELDASSLGTGDLAYYGDATY